MSRIILLAGVWLALVGCGTDRNSDIPAAEDYQQESGKADADDGEARWQCTRSTAIQGWLFELQTKSLDLAINKMNLILARKGMNASLSPEMLLGQVETMSVSMACPLLSPSSVENPDMSCLSLVDLLREELNPELNSLLESHLDELLLNLGAVSHGRKRSDLEDWSAVVFERVYSSISDLARNNELCDRVPSRQEMIYHFGLQKSQALFAQVEAELLPSISPEECDVDAIVTRIRKESQSRAKSFLKTNPLCENVSTAELAKALEMDHAQLEAEQDAGLQAGLEDASQRLRARLTFSQGCACH